MAHFALLDENKTVINVVVVADAKLGDIPQPVTAEDIAGRNFLRDVQGQWVQTSYNANFRANFAQIGGTYNHEHDVFIPKKPTLGNWELNTTTWRWDSLDDLDE